ncbi:MAG: hypothetical protein JO256_13175 [Alphaproteobacteria bacterium]|nr:hypothetical protein [Alphaproteobacteria bacterium]
MGQTIDTSQIVHVARLLRDSAPSMPAAQDQRLFLKAAQALETRATKLTYGTPATSSGRLDLLV